VRSHRYIQKIDFYGIKYEAEFIRCKSRERYSVKYNIKKVDNNLIGKKLYININVTLKKIYNLLN
jgi:hypothetical protein